MTLQEVIKSRKLFKRGNYMWLIIHNNHIYVDMTQTRYFKGFDFQNPIDMTVDDILADDWMNETKEDLRDRFDRTGIFLEGGI